MGTTLFDDPLMLHCKAAAQDWLHSDDPLVQDFGARLMFILSSQDVSLSQRGKNVPPEGLLPEEFQHYPWDIGTLLGKAEYKKHEFQSEAPMRQFYAFEDLEHVALRLGVFWTSPHWHYSPHVYKSLELHHRVCGQGQYFTSNDGQVESMDMSPGDIYVHLPSTMYGFESWDEPLLTLWAERVVDVDQVPRVIRDVQEVRADLDTRRPSLVASRGCVGATLRSEAAAIFASSFHATRGERCSTLRGCAQCVSVMSLVSKPGIYAAHGCSIETIEGLHHV